MGQNTFADWFINAMLGWIRWIAGSVASMFQTSSSRMSSGNALMNWFTSNWLMLLLSLIVLGVIVDWIVWMVRWRPYWLWFRRKRVLYDDDIDIDLSDEELMRRYGTLEPRVDKNRHFRASPLGRFGRPLYEQEEAGGDLDDLYEDEPDIEAPYDDVVYYQDVEEEDEDDDYVPKKRRRELLTDDDFEPEPLLDDYEVDERFDSLYDDDSALEEDGEDFLGFDDGVDAPDLSEPEARERPRKAWFSARRQREGAMDDEDPFSVNDDEFEDEDDEFFHAVSEPPRYEQEPPMETRDQHTSVYHKTDAEIARELVPGLGSELDDARFDDSEALPEPAPNSRRARRLQRESQRGDDQ